ncbi:hypothetical protein SALBM217S_08119 [Streptomyces griseoloalbus]
MAAGAGAGAAACGGTAGAVACCGPDGGAAGADAAADAAAARSAAAFPAAKPGRPAPGVPPGFASPARGETARKVIVPSSGAGACAEPAVGLRKTNVPSARGVSEAAAAGSDAAGPPCVAGGVCGTRGSAPAAPQETLRSWSPPNPDWRERSAPQAEAGSGRLPCWASAGDGAAGAGASSGSSSKKCGPVSSTDGVAGAAPCGVAGAAPGGGASGSPSAGAGRLVPGTQEAPFQYRTYPGMEGSG